MIKKLILPVLLMFVFVNLNAQEFSAGVTGGMVISQVDGDSFGGYNKFAGTGGLFVHNTLGDRWGFRMELKYIQKGSKAVDQKNPGTLYYRVKLNYIEIPFLFEYNLHGLKIPPKIDLNFNNKLKITAGPSVAYLFNAIEEDNPQYPNDATNTFTRVEIGGQIGFTYFIGEHLAFDYRFLYTFLPIRFSPNTELYYWVNWEFNRVMTFSLMYQF
ncbi:MAG TPA: porin family protein [Bacteroidales bacterium]|nr:porin family protein [Bacteroidales bacterium]